jgi:hypothetical protein
MAREGGPPRWFHIERRRFGTIFFEEMRKGWRLENLGGPSGVYAPAGVRRTGGAGHDIFVFWRANASRFAVGFPESSRAGLCVFQFGIDVCCTEANFPRTALRFRANDTLVILFEYSML